MIFFLVRVFVTFIVVYIILTIARDVLIALGLLHRRSVKKESAEPRQQEPAVRPKEEYRDVQEAKFKEIKKK